MPTYCVPTLGGVPGSANNFDWWTANPPPNDLQHSPDNPDWLGAFSLSEGNGANRDYVFRAIRGFVGAQDHLFLSFLVRVSSNEPFLNRVNFLLGNSPNYVAFQIQLNNAASVIAGTENNAVFVYKVQSCVAAAGQLATSGPVSQNEPDLEVSGRMWVDVTAPGRNLLTKWAFQVAIPLGVGWTTKGLNVPASGAFKFWYEVYSSTGSGMGASTVLHQMVNVPAATHTTSSTQLIPPVGTPLLETNLLDLSTAGVGCTAGVGLDWSGVGTRNVGGGARPDPWTIQLDLGQAYPPNLAIGAGPDYNETITPDVTLPAHQNEFFAVPTFPVGTNTAALRARFSLANWGSQYSIPTASSWRPIPGGEDVQFLSPDMKFVWPLGVTADAFTTTLVRNINKFLNATGNGTPIPADAQNPHQCMLVELSSTDPAVVITTSSTYTNMNIASASTFRRFAAISVEGIPPISPRPRDVYLYLQTYNMPTVAPPNDNPDRPTLKTFASGGSAAGGRRSNEVEDIAAFFPTYTVHAYHDTGEKFELEDGRKVLILRPQTAFGYFAAHQGPLAGWDSRIYGAEKLEENYYVIRVPNNGKAYVETVLQARENSSVPPLPDDSGPPKCKGCLAALICFLKKLFHIS